MQVVVDNFDANISSQNGLQSTDALALLLTQTSDANNTIQSETIPRIRKEDMTVPVDSNVIVQRFNESKYPDMPQIKANKLGPFYIYLFLFSALDIIQYITYKMHISFNTLRMNLSTFQRRALWYLI